MLAFDSVKAPGAYEFKVIHIIKGQLDTHLSIDLPYVFSYNYGEYWKSRPNIAVGGDFLLLLQRNGTVYSPTASKLPLIPIPLDASTGNDNDITMQVANLLLPSGPEPSLQLADSYLLRTLTDPQLVVKLIPYLGAPNIYVRDNVLACLAANQQVAVIPRIVQLSASPEFHNHPSNSVPALQSFVVPDSIPYLNPLLFNADYDIRTHAMYALYKIADRSSIPYLILALRDPDPQQNISGGAYVALRRLIPALGRYVPETGAEFSHNFNTEIRPINAWWNDELSGKHLKPEDKPAATVDIPDDPAHLDTLLFVPYAATRQAAMTKLETLADAASVPYLALALQDPDSGVAYGAYKTLHRLIPTLGTAKDKAVFGANRAGESQPIYDWWKDELLGKHLQKSAVQK